MGLFNHLLFYVLPWSYIIFKQMKHLWDNYRQTLFSIFPDLDYGETWAKWESKETLRKIELSEMPDYLNKNYNKYSNWLEI